MSYKHGLSYGTSVVYQFIARNMERSVRFIPDYLDNCIETQPMAYDAADTTQKEKFGEEAGL